jgi:hypothetical protein
MNDSIQELFNFSIPSKPIDDKHLELLLSLVEHPGITAINIFKSENGISINKKANYSNIISRRFKKLYKLKLVEKMPGFKSREHDVKACIPYKLSPSGIFYVLLNYPNNISREKFIFYLLRNYPSYILFTQFIYPIIDLRRLLAEANNKITSFELLLVHIYLKHICKEIQNLVSSKIIHHAEGYILKKLFDWPCNSESLPLYKSTPFGDDMLREYLKSKFNWTWIDKSQIEPNYDKNYIDIYNPNKIDEIIRLLINEKENRTILTMNHKEIDEFVIINNGLHSSINVKTGEKKEDLFLHILYRKCKWHKNAFQKGIRSNPTVSMIGSQVHVRVSHSVKALKIMDAKGDMIKPHLYIPFFNC